jgi:hypothetical protein
MNKASDDNASGDAKICSKVVILRTCGMKKVFKNLVGCDNINGPGIVLSLDNVNALLNGVNP